jgi:ribosome-associated translation inhibitor RaiA
MAESRPEFTLEFRVESESVEPENAMRREADTQLRELTYDHNDIVGAAVAVEELTGSETPHMYEARVVVYMRPNNLTVVEKAPESLQALQDALSTMERRVREERARLRDKQRGQTP